MRTLHLRCLNRPYTLMKGNDLPSPENTLGAGTRSGVTATQDGVFAYFLGRVSSGCEISGIVRFWPGPAVRLCDPTVRFVIRR